MTKEYIKEYTKPYEVMYRDSDYKLRCKLESIVDFFCDIGNIHAEKMGDSIDFQIAHGCTWVFYKYDIKMYKYPKYRQKVYVTTMPAGFKKFYAYRNYIVKSEEGELLAEATALFFLINIEKRRPARIFKEYYDMYDQEDDLDKAIDMEKIEKPTREDYYKEFQIRYSDIDSNTHVNNAKYIEWAVESVPLEVVKDYQVSRMKVVFEKETTYGNKIHVSAEVKKEGDKLITLHRITNKDGEELTLLEAHWTKAED
ncbi:acyl-[acyl-carrier-protein] thioesterase [Eubacterium multiforme]|uniref:Acyl-ACP thioesterase n=1 Tax=Eubacterium multiforme TaxID=83339 RepID=A0ABT9UXT7_9FIRM|nr:acyl-ACP thioesterase domain-containing protein [Eubacterium multiforme]MDQ0151130.1 acyl-ACP thioesterase [Eubacterium multiforme]